MKSATLILLTCLLFPFPPPASAHPAATSQPPAKIDLSALQSPVLFRGDATTAYRDPAAIYHDGWCRQFFTLVRIEPDGKVFSYIAWSKSQDLVHWSEPKIFSPRDQRLNFG